MLEKLESIYNRFLQLQEQLSDPEIVSDMKRFTKLNKDYKGLEAIAKMYLKYKNVLENTASATSMLKEEDDAEMREMAKMELEELKSTRESMEEEIKIMLIPKDPDDDKDVVMEIRAGTGGNEASIFVGDLHRLYTKFFETVGFKTEILDLNEGTAGGYSKIVFEVFGNDVYGTLKFESGAHRVQRVPKTESQGRVHTSAVTVAVLPKFEMEDIDIRKDELRVDTFRASGAGGQHVNKTESGVRFTHIPTGIAAESTDSRSQHKNREIALQRLYQKIREVTETRAKSEHANKRKSLVGSGDRSDKIRTYNYPQNRVTDHRINLTLYSLDKIMDGELKGVVDALIMAENTSKMQEGETA